MAFLFSRHLRTQQASRLRKWLVQVYSKLQFFCHKPETELEGHRRCHLTRWERKSVCDLVVSLVLKPLVLTG